MTTPTPIFVTRTMPSPRVQALAQNLAQAVRAEQARDAALTAAEVRQAFAVAIEQLGGELASSRSQQVVAGALVALATLAAGALAWFNSQH